MKITDEELRKVREQKISRALQTSENLVRHAFNQGYELGYQQHGKDFVENGEKAYQKGLEDGKRQGVAIDGDKRYWDGYHAAQEDGQKIYQKGYEDGARCQDEVQYQKGLDDAWNMVKYICLGGKEWVLLKVFGTFSITKIITDNTASEAIEKIQEYEEKQKDKIDIKVGTKVRTTKDKDRNGVDVFPIGTVCTVTEIMQSIPQYKVSANGTYWWYSADMFEVIEEDEE